jgi:hypothetical protein
MDKITDKAGLPRFTFHALRHTFATRRLEANAPAKVVQDILGHADVTLTLNTYSHVIGTTAHEQMSKIDGLFQPANKQISDAEPPKQSVLQQIEDSRRQPKLPSKPPQKNEKKKSDPDL